MDKRLQRVDDFMKKRFAEKVKLLEAYGPIQMCVFGLTYKHIELKKKRQRSWSAYQSAGSDRERHQQHKTCH